MYQLFLIQKLSKYIDYYLGLTIQAGGASTTAINKGYADRILQKLRSKLGNNFKFEHIIKKLFNNNNYGLNLLNVMINFSENVEIDSTDFIEIMIKFIINRKHNDDNDLQKNINALLDDNKQTLPSEKTPEQKIITKFLERFKTEVTIGRIPNFINR